MAKPTHSNYTLTQAAAYLGKNSDGDEYDAEEVESLIEDGNLIACAYCPSTHRWGFSEKIPVESSKTRFFWSLFTACTSACTFDAVSAPIQPGSYCFLELWRVNSRRRLTLP